ncbi:MAG: ribosome-associated translation inhibitor RaiA [Candidatus Aminicenantales bacterium]
MNIHFTARQAILTPEIKDYCEKRLARLKGPSGDILDVNVILGVQRNRSRAEIHVIAKGASLIVVEETLDMMGSLNQAFDNLEKKIKKEREKWRERRRRGGRERKELVDLPETAEPEKRVIRSQNFSAKPLSLQEAVAQFEFKNREVLVFRREGSENWAVLYRRKDGNFGLVEPG